MSGDRETMTARSMNRHHANMSSPIVVLKSAELCLILRILVLFIRLYIKDIGFLIYRKNTDHHPALINSDYSDTMVS